ncbi:hypothetical protein [Gracilimonas sp.]|uniref:hypothetical protein n=1 Tax=Gracilimonas sp. TaxID=1974203 RepID=UPI0028711882|nr:hypothetical protein [Gracilimonas sp.]
MKNIISVILLALLLTTGLKAQQDITNQKHERVITHVENNLYDVKFLNEKGDVVQKGQYWRDGESILPHGTWLLFSGNVKDKVVTKATFDKGEQLTVETFINGKLVQADQQQLAAKNN